MKTIKRKKLASEPEKGQDSVKLFTRFKEQYERKFKIRATLITTAVVLGIIVLALKLHPPSPKITEKQAKPKPAQMEKFRGDKEVSRTHEVFEYCADPGIPATFTEETKLCPSEKDAHATFFEPEAAKRAKEEEKRPEAVKKKPKAKGKKEKREEPEKEERSELSKKLASIQLEIENSSGCRQGMMQEEFPYRLVELSDYSKYVIEIEIGKCEAEVRDGKDGFWFAIVTPNYSSFSFSYNGKEIGILLDSEEITICGNVIALTEKALVQVKSQAMLHSILGRAVEKIRDARVSNAAERRVASFAIEDMKKERRKIETEIGKILENAEGAQPPQDM